jgi:hypothetical protein
MMNEPHLCCVHNRNDNLDARLGIIERSLARMRDTLGEVQEDLASISVAVDKDAETLIKTNRRLSQLAKGLKVA